MSDPNEAITKIGGRTITARNFVPQETVEDWADRIEAELAREREMDKGMSKKLDGNRAIPNGAAMRKALEEQMHYWNAHIRTREEEEMRKRTQAALSAPARNCDAMTSSEAKLAWGEYRHSVPLPHGGWTAEHVIDWLFTEAEGGAE